MTGDSRSQPIKNELRSFSQSTRDGRCLEVWFARNVSDEDRADLLAAVNSHATLQARNEQLEAALDRLIVRNAVLRKAAEASRAALADGGIEKTPFVDDALRLIDAALSHKPESETGNG